jgi:small subunit ribosomal protein S8e
MGISRDSRHKRRATGGRMPIHKKKRKFEMGRTPAATKIGHKKIRVVRGRGGNNKYRALTLDSGNFTWQSE